MNADDLSKAKQIAADLKRMSPESNMVEIVCRLLDEYEMQAKQIASLEEHERQTHEILGNILGKDTSLEAGARRAMEQIATLKAALIRERERYIDDFVYEYDPAEDRSHATKEQLARELPEIDWSDMQ